VKLVINRHPRPGEVFISGDDHPDRIRDRVDSVMEIEKDTDGHTIHAGDAIVVTFSPVVIDHFIRVCRVENKPHPMASVYYFFGGEEFRLVDFMEEAWLVHYDVGNLYSDREIDRQLNAHLVKKMLIGS